MAFANSLYFVAQVQNDTVITSALYRLTQDGEVERVADLTGLGPVNVVYPGEPVETATRADGDYLVLMGGRGPAQYYSVSVDGVVTQVTDFVRPGYPGALQGVAALADTLFYRGNQQTPSGTEELYRLTPDGTETILFNDPVETVFDLETAGGSLWFATRVVDPENVISRLWRAGATGDAVPVDLGQRINPVLLDTDIPGGGLALFYYQTDEFDEVIGTGLMRIAADGTRSDILPLGSDYEVMDTVVFNRTLYFMGNQPGDSATRLFRVGVDGAVSEVTGFGNGVVDPNVHHLAAQKDRLLFVGDMMVSDGFGGMELATEVLYALGKDGVVEVLAGAPGHDPTMFTLDTFSFAIDLADPILGTVGDDLRTGTQRSEVISVMTGNDTVRARAGQDTVLGGDGDDRLAGDAGSDSLSGGNGADRLVGGDGNDSLFGNAGDDQLSGNAGADTLAGDPGQDLLDGGAGADALNGGGGNDTLRGAAGADKLAGAAGADQIAGGLGDDSLTGGDGRDMFVFTAGRDRIVDFQDNQDTIRLSEAIWGGGLRVQEVLDTFARDTAVGVILDFGANVLIVEGAPSIAALLDDIVLIP